jgi:hypothetical protein
MKRKREYIRAADKIASLLVDFHPSFSQDEREALRRLNPPEAHINREFEWDHVVLHAFGGSSKWRNVQAVRRADHREKSRRDTSIVAKTKRIQEANAQHIARMAELGKAVTDRFIQNTEVLRSFRAKRRWPSRSFPKGRKVRVQLKQREE